MFVQSGELITPALILPKLHSVMSGQTETELISIQNLPRYKSRSENVL